MSLDDTAQFRLELLRAGMMGGAALDAALAAAREAWAFVEGGGVPGAPPAPQLMLPPPAAKAAPARDVSPGERWAFTEHRSLAEVAAPASAAAAPRERESALRTPPARARPRPEEAKRHCANEKCLALLVRRDTEGRPQFLKRKYCCSRCANIVTYQTRLAAGTRPGRKKAIVSAAAGAEISAPTPGGAAVEVPFGAVTPSPRLAPAAPPPRAAVDATLISSFIAERGVTKCPPAAVEVTSADLSSVPGRDIIRQRHDTENEQKHSEAVFAHRPRTGERLRPSKFNKSGRSVA